MSARGLKSLLLDRSNQQGAFRCCNAWHCTDRFGALHATQTIHQHLCAMEIVTLTEDRLKTHSRVDNASKFDHCRDRGFEATKSILVVSIRDC